MTSSLFFRGKELSLLLKLLWMDWQANCSYIVAAQDVEPVKIKYTMTKPLMLIVDDEEDIRSLLSEIFKPNFTVMTSGSIGEGQVRLKSHQGIDVLLLDLDLPDGSGFDLISSLNGEIDKDHVLIISAHKGRVQQNKAEKLGITHFFEKPIDLNKLRSTVQQLIH